MISAMRPGQANILECIISVLTFEIQFCRGVGKSSDTSPDFFRGKADGNWWEGQLLCLTYGLK